MVLPVSQKTYFVCTIPDVSEFLLSLRQKIRQKFIPVIKGGQLCSDKARILTFIFTNLFRRIEHTIALRLFENCMRKFLENRQAPIKVKTFTKGQKKSKCNKHKNGEYQTNCWSFQWSIWQPLCLDNSTFTTASACGLTFTV